MKTILRQEIKNFIIIKFSPAFFKRRRIQRRGAFVVLRRARNFYFGVFFLIAFSFAPVYAKEKADEKPDFLLWMLTELRLYTVGANIVRPRRIIM